MLNRFPILADLQYRKYVAASVLTAIGSGMNFIALSWFLYSMTSSALAIGWILVISTLPGILFSPWIGALVDRWNPKSICIGADLARGVVLGFVCACMYTGHLTVEIIYLATFLVAICENFFQPAVGALIRDVTYDDQLLQANIVSNMSMQIGGLCGASIGGFLVANFGAPVVIFVNVISFFISAILTWWIKPRRTRAHAATERAKQNFMREFRDTIAYLSGRRFIVWLAVQQMCVYVTLYICNTLLPIFVVRELHSSAQGFGLIDAAWGVGALLGGLSLTEIARRLPPQQFGNIGLLLMVLSLILFLTGEQVPQVALAYSMLGFLACVIRINTDTIIVSEVDPAYFGRIKAIISMFIAYVSLAVYITVGYAGDRMSVRYIFLVLAMLILLVVLIPSLRAGKLTNTSGNRWFRRRL